MTSFAACGHPVLLYVYEEPGGVPGNVSVVDAEQLIPRKELFKYSKTGSFAPFADWFRYRVLYERGGVWADTDVVCLQPLAYARPEIYAWQDDVQINNAVLGLPAQHPLAKWMMECCEQPNRVLPYDDGRSRRRKWRRRWLEGNRRGNVKWGEYGPAGFTLAARHLGFVELALPPQEFYPAPFKQWRSVFEPTQRDWGATLANSKALHLWNEMMRREAGFDKNARFAPSSLFEQLCARYLKDDN